MQFPTSPSSRRTGGLGAALILVLAVSGCGDSSGGAGGGSAVTADQFEQIPLGVAKGEIRYELGEPAAEREEDGAHCLEYRESEGEGIGRPGMFRLCFRDGTLVRKSSF